MPYTQANRLIAIETGLSGLGYPDESLLLASFSGQEAMSRLFSFHLDLLQEKAVVGYKGVSFKDIIGKNVTITVALADGTPRYFNGLVSRFALSGEDAAFLHYQMEVVPWTWLLTRYADCKIFHNQTVSDIIQAVFSDRQQTDFKLQLNSTYPKLEYCVQYRETDFNFISRLMEQFGIFYYFEHEDGKHTMVIADSSNSLSPLDGQSDVSFNLAGGGRNDEDVIHSISIEQALLSGKYTLNDYYFETPSANLLTSEPTVWGGDNNQELELYDYPGDYTNRTDGNAAVKLRMQEVEAGYTTLQGSSNCRSFTTGYNFDLKDAPQTAMNTTYVLTEIKHLASAVGGYSGTGAEGDAGSDSYSNHFTCIPATLPFRPARLTPKPFVQGPQTAVVVGKNQISDDTDSGESGSDGEEIWVDKFGRVMVLFPWDRLTACSCWVRVSQEWAGQGWGSMTIPRVGQEVIVSFIEGDPDRPIITGRVYNATQLVPYKLPDYQTRSTFMTRSSKGGSASTYNELRFEDKTGAEQVFIRAQYDYDTQVLHDTREAIGNNRSLTVAKDQMESVGGDQHFTISGNVTESIGKDVNSAISGGVVESVGKDVNTAISGGVVESVGKDVNLTISGGLIESVGQNQNTSVGQNLNMKAGTTINMNAGTSLVVASGTAYSHNAGTSIDLKGGTTVTVEAGVTLTLVAGSSSIQLGPAGVSITGTMVMINSGGGGGSANAPSPASPSSPSNPTSPGSPTAPDKADDGKTGTKLGSGDFASTAGTSSSSSDSSSSSSSDLLDLGTIAPNAVVSGAGGAAAGAAGAAAGAASGAANQATQAAQQATQAAAQGAQQAANTAQAAAAEAQTAAQQAEQQAQQAAQQAEQQAQQTAAQAQAAAAQAQQAANQAVGQAKAAAQQAANQAAAAAQQAQAAAAQAEAQAQAEAAKVEQQAQATAAQAQAAANQAEQQAKAAAAQAQQQAQQAAQQGQQAAQQAQQAAQQAQQQAQQAAQQAQAAAQQAQQQAQQAAGQVKQAAAGAQQQASQAAAGAQQAASQAMGSIPKGL